jgi:hypothetical protein
MAKSKIKFNDVSSANGTQKIQLPKYSSQVINLANGYSKATRPANPIASHLHQYSHELFEATKIRISYSIA